MKLSDLKEKVEVVDPRTKKRLKLTVSEAIGIYVYNKNQQAKEHVTYGNGISEEGQVAVIAKLTDAQKKLGDIGMKEVGSNYPRMADAYHATLGLSLTCAGIFTIFNLWMTVWTFRKEWISTRGQG